MFAAIFWFIVLLGLPMASIIWTREQADQQRILLTIGLSALAFIAALLLPRLLRRVRFRRLRRPSARALATLAWPANLTRGELEQYCIAWLQAQGWAVRLSTDPEPEIDRVYILATRGAGTVGVMCDQGGEDLNPAIIRALALESARLRVTHPVLLTLVPGRLPSPAEIAARNAGVRLLRVAELPQLAELAPEPAAEPAVAG